MTNLEKYNKAFTDTFGVSEDVLGESFTFKDVPVWDSVAHLSLISELEDTFDVLFDADDILHYGSYLNGIEILKRYGVDFDN
jgi:acyl carrier protein